MHREGCHCRIKVTIWKGKVLGNGVDSGRYIFWAL